VGVGVPGGVVPEGESVVASVVAVHWRRRFSVRRLALRALSAAEPFAERSLNCFVPLAAPATPSGVVFAPLPSRRRFGVGAAAVAVLLAAAFCLSWAAFAAHDAGGAIAGSVVPAKLPAAMRASRHRPRIKLARSGVEASPGLDA